MAESDHGCVVQILFKQLSLDPDPSSVFQKEFANHIIIHDRAHFLFANVEAIRYQAREEIAMKKMMDANGCMAFSNTFQDLYGMEQLPGLASQHLMAQGYGYGGEGDWKTAALVRTAWYMGQGLPKGSSFLEDYTIHFDGANSALLQAHMLEISPAIAAEKPKLEVHHLGIGVRKTQTARLVFTSKTGDGVAVTVVDMGNRFRLIVNEVRCIESKPLPKLPVASALWIPKPSFEVGAAAWMLAGGTHHTSFSYDLTTEYWEDYAEIADVELLVIDDNTTISNFKRDMRINEVYYMLNKALK